MAALRPLESERPFSSSRPSRPSPGVLFWVVGPSLLITLGMFTSSPQCVLNPQLSCSQNWIVSDGVLTVWPLNALWLSLARITILIALSVVWSAILYHIVLAMRGITPITPFVFMGATCAILIPPTLFLMFTKFMSSNNMQELAPPLKTEQGTYYLFAYERSGQRALLLSRGGSRQSFAIVSELLELIPQSRIHPAPVILPAALQERLNGAPQGVILASAPDRRSIVALGEPSLALLTYDLGDEEMPSAGLIELPSPFVMIDRETRLDDKDLGSFIEALPTDDYGERVLPPLDSLWPGVDHPNPEVRRLLLKLAPYYPERSEAAALVREVQMRDPVPRIREEAARVLSNGLGRGLDEEPTVDNELGELPAPDPSAAGAQ